MGLQSVPDARVFVRHSGESKMTQVAVKMEQLKKQLRGRHAVCPSHSLTSLLIHFGKLLDFNFLRQHCLW